MADWNLTIFIYLSLVLFYHQDKVYFGPYLITVRNEVAKVMFLQACVCPQGGSTWPGIPPGRYTPPAGTPPGRYTPPDQVPPRQVPPQDQVHPPRQVPPWAGLPRPGTPPPGTRYTTPRAGAPPRYGHCCGQYTSYWNAFLFFHNFFLPCFTQHIISLIFCFFIVQIQKFCSLASLGIWFLT